MEMKDYGKQIHFASAKPPGQAYTSTRRTVKAPLIRRFVDSFKRDPNACATPKISASSRVYDLAGAAAATAESPLARKLKGRQLQMIAFGGSIGTGLFVGSGSALARGGPAALLIGFGLIGIMIYCTIYALGELAVMFPVSGSFSAYATRFVDPAWGFAMGWAYAFQWLITLPVEIVGATLTIQYWSHGRINNNAWVAIFLAFVTTLNLLGVKWYGEAEFVLSIIKIAAIIGFSILGVILDIAGGPGGSAIGSKYWRDPGPFHHGFKGMCSVFVTAAFAFGGSELIGLAAAETANPRKSLPSAAKKIFWRVTLFYMVSLTLVGLLVPYNDKRLLNGSSGADATASPFVIAIENAGIEGLPSLMNVIIMFAVLSVGNSSVYAASRTLAALADQRQAPHILAYIDRKGRPTVAIVVTCMFGLLAFLAGSKQLVAFDWMLAITGLNGIIIWGSICLAHIRFRRGWKVQGHSLDDLAFRSQPGLVGSWIGFSICILALVSQFWTAIAPIGYEKMTKLEIATNFLQAYLAAPTLLILYICYKIYYRTPVVRSHNMDLHTGIREFNIAALIAEERARRKAWPMWKVVWKFFC